MGALSLFFRWRTSKNTSKTARNTADMRDMMVADRFARLPLEEKAQVKGSYAWRIATDTETYTKSIAFSEKQLAKAQAKGNDRGVRVWEKAIRKDQAKLDKLAVKAAQANLNKITGA